MKEATPSIILASGSPRRRDLLSGLNLNFEVVPADIDETARADESPEALVERLSLEKARVVAQNYSDALVIAADTVVVLAGEILGKPVDSTQNQIFIERLAGRDHSVFTGHALVYKSEVRSIVRQTRVRFRPLTKAEIAAYVATDEGLDKAGGYAIQGYGAALIPHIEGDYFNVVGLSVATVVTAAADLGVRLV